VNSAVNLVSGGAHAVFRRGPKYEVMALHVNRFLIIFSYTICIIRSKSYPTLHLVLVLVTFLISTKLWLTDIDKPTLRWLGSQTWNTFASGSDCIYILVVH